MLNALWIVLLGMALVFAVLAILLLVVTIVSKLVQPKQKKKLDNS